jgi:hypothetical protein
MLYLRRFLFDWLLLLCWLFLLLLSTVLILIVTIEQSTLLWRSWLRLV